MKKFLLMLIFMFSCLVLQVNAVSSDAKVGNNFTEYSCGSFQEDSKNIVGETYFGRCMEARCDGNKWKLKYYENKSVTCKNGNLNPYIQIPSNKDGCMNYRGSSCSSSSIRYCTTITYYDCDRTTDGSKYVTTTKTTTTKKPTKTKNTTKTTSAVVTEPIKNNNTNLTDIKLSSGSINFNKEVKEYSISVESNISFITVNAIPEVSTSKVVVTGNTNLKSGTNQILITVTAEDGSIGSYKITVNKKSVLASNANLNSILINGKPLDKFVSNVTNYSYKTKDKSISVSATAEDENATVEISDTNNLKDGSVIKITVTAEDSKTVQEYLITIDVPSSGAGIITIVFIVILVIVIAGGAFYFFTKQKNGGSKEYEYE